MKCTALNIKHKASSFLQTQNVNLPWITSDV